MARFVSILRCPAERESVCSLAGRKLPIIAILRASHDSEPVQRSISIVSHRFKLSSEHV